MAKRTERVVARIQRWWQSAGSAGRTGRPNPRDVAELEARVDRLYALGGRFACIRLSDDVADYAATKLWSRGGGTCVATEV